MFASIRQYRTSDAAEIGRRANDGDSGFAPIARDTPGIAAWYLIDGGDGTIVTVTVCEDESAAEDSVKLAASWVGENAPELVEGSPTVTNGEVTAQS
jgi:hypothetical protein